MAQTEQNHRQQLYDCENQPSSKSPFWTMVSKIYGPAKLGVLVTWEDSILFKKSMTHFFGFIPGFPRVTPYTQKIASKFGL